MADSDEPLTNHQPEANNEGLDPRPTTINEVLQLFKSYKRNETTLGGVLSSIKELHNKFDAHTRQFQAQRSSADTGGNKKKCIVNNNNSNNKYYYYYGDASRPTHQGESGPQSDRKNDREPNRDGSGADGSSSDGSSADESSEDDSSEDSSSGDSSSADESIEDGSNEDGSNEDVPNADVPNTDVPDTNIPDAHAPNADEPHTNVQMTEESRGDAEHSNYGDEDAAGLDKDQFHTTEVRKNESFASSANNGAENRLTNPSNVEQDSPAQQGGGKRRGSVKPGWTREDRNHNVKTRGVDVNPENNRGAIIPSPPGGGRTLRPQPVGRGMTPVTEEKVRRGPIAKPCRNSFRRSSAVQDTSSALIESKKNRKPKVGASKLSKVNEEYELAESNFGQPSLVPINDQTQRSGRIASSPNLSAPRVNPDTRGRTPKKRTHSQSSGMEETEDNRSSGYPSKIQGFHPKRHKSTPEQQTPTQASPQQEADEGDQEPGDLALKTGSKKKKSKGKNP